MKKIFLFCGLLLLIGYSGQGQGKDVIFWVDNSGSTSGAPYQNIQNSVQALMAKILSCPNNRVTVVQHAGNVLSTPSSTRIWIESPFTTTAFTFPNRNLGSFDYAHNALGLIGNALDHIPSSSILGVGNLTKLPGNQLVIIFFTDSDRDFHSSALVNLASPAIGNNGAFTNYTAFKSNRNASFRVILLPNPAGTNTPTAAAIASQGGPYTGARESYSADPDFFNPTQRRLYNTTTLFAMTDAEINAVANDICSVTFPTPTCQATLNVTGTVSGIDNRQASTRITASNSITSTGVGVYHAGTEVVLSQNFHSATGSRFRGYIAGCTNSYVGREAVEEDEVITKNAPDIKSPVVLDVYPNPSSSIVTVESPNEIKSVSIITFEGKLIFTKKLPDAKYFDMDINNYSNGIYLMNIEFTDGTLVSKKLVKN